MPSGTAIGARSRRPRRGTGARTCLFVLPRGRALLIENREPFVLHSGVDGWQRVEDRPSTPLGLGMHGVRMTDADAPYQVNFTLLSGRKPLGGADDVVSTEARDEKN